jgi:hypothetical protein
MFLSTLFSNTLSLCSCLSVIHTQLHRQVSRILLMLPLY